MFGPAEYYNTDSRGNVTSTVLNSWWQDDTSLAYSPRQSDLKKYYLRDSSTRFTEAVDRMAAAPTIAAHHHLSPH